MDQPAAVCRQVEQQVGVAVDAVIIDQLQVLAGLDPVVLIGVVVPARADGDVHLGRQPVGAVLVVRSAAQVAKRAGVEFIAVEGTPVGGVGEAAFRAHPADVGTASLKMTASGWYLRTVAMKPGNRRSAGSYALRLPLRRTTPRRYRRSR